MDIQSPNTTAGPWKANRGGVESDRGGPICAGQFNTTAGVPLVSCKANMQLIAAAPELYDFLIQYLYSEHGICAAHHYACPFSADQLRDKATALIEKIEGSAE